MRVICSHSGTYCDKRGCFHECVLYPYYEPTRFVPISTPVVVGAIDLSAVHSKKPANRLMVRPKPSKHGRYCCYCGRKLTGGLTETKEHLLPVSANGNNSKANKQLCCSSCNQWRGNKPLPTWLTEITACNIIKINRRFRATYTKYDLECMTENVKWWINYVKKNMKALKKQGTGSAVF